MWSPLCSQHPGQVSGPRKYSWYLRVDTPECQILVPMSAPGDPCMDPLGGGKPARQGLSRGVAHSPSGTPPRPIQASSVLKTWGPSFPGPSGGFSAPLGLRLQTQQAHHDCPRRPPTKPQPSEQGVSRDVAKPGSGVRCPRSLDPSRPQWGHLEKVPRTARVPCRPSAGIQWGILRSGPVP